MSRITVYLASASPRRASLLRQLGVHAVRCPAEIEERPLAGEAPEDMARRLAEAKGREALARLEASAGLVLAADTIVVLDGVILGKPADAAEAVRMLGVLRGREHRVLTGVFLQRTDDGRCLVDLAETRVRLRDFDDATLDAYVRTGDALDKAGAYGIQGAGVLLVEAITGSFSNVVGLPLERLPGWLGQLGLALSDVLGHPWPTSSA